MTPILIIVIYICSACGVGSMVIIVGSHTIRVLSNKRYKLITTKHIEAVSAILNNQTDINLRLPNTNSRQAKLSLITVLSQVSSTYYGYNKHAIEKLIDIYELDKEIVHRIKHSAGTQRALYIQLAAKLPLSREVAEKCQQYGKDNNRYVRLHTLLLHLTRHPYLAPQIIEAHSHQLTDLELRQVVNTIANNQMPMSMIGNFLRSSNHNLQFIGLELLQLYEYRELLPLLTTLLSTNNENIQQKALHTVAKLHSDINATEVAHTVTALRTHHRKRFYRLCITEGYSIRSFSEIIAHEDDRSLKNYIANSINSHKKDLSTYSVN